MADTKPDKEITTAETTLKELVKDFKPVQNLQTDQIEQIITLRTRHNLSVTDIGKIVGCHPSTAFRIIRKSDKAYKRLEKWKTNRSNEFANQQMEESNLQSIIREHLLSMDETGQRRILQLSESQQTAIYQAFNISKGTMYDKERLENDLSTENVRHAHSMIDEIEEVRKAQKLLGDDTEIVDVLPEESEPKPDTKD